MKKLIIEVGFNEASLNNIIKYKKKILYEIKYLFNKNFFFCEISINYTSRRLLFYLKNLKKKKKKNKIKIISNLELFNLCYEFSKKINYFFHEKLLKDFFISKPITWVFFITNCSKLNYKLLKKFKNLSRHSRLFLNCIKINNIKEYFILLKNNFIFFSKNRKRKNFLFFLNLNFSNLKKILFFKKFFFNSINFLEFIYIYPISFIINKFFKKLCLKRFIIDNFFPVIYNYYLNFKFIFFISNKRNNNFNFLNFKYNSINCNIKDDYYLFKKKQVLSILDIFYLSKKKNFINYNVNYLSKLFKINFFINYFFLFFKINKVNNFFFLFLNFIFNINFYINKNFLKKYDFFFFYFFLNNKNCFFFSKIFFFFEKNKFILKILNILDDLFLNLYINGIPKSKLDPYSIRKNSIFLINLIFKYDKNIIISDFVLFYIYFFKKNNFKIINFLYFFFSFFFSRIKFFFIEIKFKKYNIKNLFFNILLNNNFNNFNLLNKKFIFIKENKKKKNIFKKLKFIKIIFKRINNLLKKKKIENFLFYFFLLNKKMLNKKEFVLYLKLKNFNLFILYRLINNNHNLFLKVFISKLNFLSLELNNFLNKNLLFSKCKKKTNIRLILILNSIKIFKLYFNFF